MDKLNKNFHKDQIVNSNEINQMSNKIDELIDSVNSNENIELTEFITEKKADEKYQPKGNYSFIEYIESTSDDEGYINTEIAPKNSIVIARMYLHPNLNMWCHCPSYESATDGDKIITGGIKYGVSIVVGGVTCQKFSNCKYRVYFIRN